MPWESITYQKKLGLLDYLTLGIFPLASMVSRGLWSGFERAESPGEKLGWGLLYLLIGLPTWLIAFTGDWLLKPLLGGLATVVIAPIPIAISIINTLTYPEIDNIQVTKNNIFCTTTTTLKELRKEYGEKLKLKPVIDPESSSSHSTISIENSDGEIARITQEADGNKDANSIEALLQSGFGKFAKNIAIAKAKAKKELRAVPDSIMSV